MKKILFCLLSFIIILSLLNISGVINNKDNDENNSIPSSTPNISNENDSDIVINENKDAYAPVEVDNETNFETSWYIYTDTGSAQNEASYISQKVNIAHGGSGIEGVRLCREGIQLNQGSTYDITFNVESTIDREITVSLRNLDNQQVLDSQKISIGKNKYVSLSFTMDEPTTWNAVLSFDVGGINQEHQITFSNIRITNDMADNTIKVNHLGYTINNEKRCVFPYNQGDFFDVINVETSQVVYTGAIVKEINNPNTNEVNYYGDFTNVMEEGTYKVVSQLGNTSYEFKINNDIYDNALVDLLRFFYIQRCAYELDPNLVGNLAHIACHDTAAIIQEFPTQVTDVNGGWHDAGDYGRYVKTGTKAVNDLLFAYLTNPEAFGDSNNIPESGNGVADILDEARFEIEWLFKMQTDWGAVYSKAVTQGLPGDIYPNEDMQRVYVLTGETATTADFISTLALASIVYKDIDPVFAQSCLDKTYKSWEYLVGNPDMIELSNPTDFTAGEYRDTKDTDERFFAAVAMWAATKDTVYLDYAKEMLNKDADAVNGNGYTDVGAYGVYLYLLQPEAKNDKEFYDIMLSSLKEQADAIMATIDADGYQTSITTYSWGSNGTIANNGNLLLMAYDIIGNSSYKQGAVEQLNYIFGKNSLNISFVSGYGYTYPVNMHSRLAKAANTPLIGALVGGANNDREDTVTQNFGTDIPPAKVYTDQYLSYSTNEVTIYWNSALIYLISGIIK